MKQLKFEHLKRFGTKEGGIITEKALITMLGVQYITCYENNNRYLVSELIELKEDENGNP